MPRRTDPDMGDSAGTGVPLVGHLQQRTSYIGQVKRLAVGMYAGAFDESTLARTDAGNPIQGLAPQTPVFHLIALVHTTCRSCRGPCRSASGSTPPAVSRAGDGPSRAGYHALGVLLARVCVRCIIGPRM